MRNKSPLALMEMMIMVLVFALAAALCVQVFVASDIASEENANRDKAIVQAQTAAELVKNKKGDFEKTAAALKGTWDGQEVACFYDENWNIQKDSQTAAYCLTISPIQSENSLLGKANINVRNTKEAEMVSFAVAWQEVAANA